MINKSSNVFLAVIIFLLAFLGFVSTPKKVSAIALCGEVSTPTIVLTTTVNGTNYTFNSNVSNGGSIDNVEPGTQITFTAYTYAEASSPNSMIFPYRPRQDFPGPTHSGRTRTTDPINSNGGSIYIWIVQNCQDDGHPTPEANLGITINVRQQNGTINVSSNMPTNWSVGPYSAQGDTQETYSNVTPGTYTLNADNLNCYSKSITPAATQDLAGGGSISFNINYTYDSGCGSPPPPPPPPPPGGSGPSVDIKANGSDGPVPVTSGTAVNVSWNSSNADSCSVSPTGWGGTSGSQSSGPLYSATNYLVTCVNGSGSASDSVYVTVGGGSGSCGAMIEDAAIRGCANYSEESPVYKPTSAQCSEYCYSRGAKACEWNDNGNCYVEYASGGCYVAPGFPGWNAVVCGQIEPPVTLTAQIWSGSGTITGPGINCPGDCTESVPLNTVVTVTGTGTNGYSLGGWGGDCNSQTSTCTLRMDGNKTALATFSPNQMSLQVSKSGSGTGDVFSNPPGGISCGSLCTNYYNYGTSVSLSASPSGGSTFGGWSGDCTGTGTCYLDMNANRSVGAAFTAAFNYTLGNSGNSSAQKASGNVYTQNTITKTLTAGVTQAVSLTASGLPSGVSYSISNGSCSPGCSSTITFTIAPTAAVGTFPITVTGSPLGKTTTFNLVITGASFSVACSASPAAILLGQSITWSASLNGGRAPFTYRWSGAGIPASPAPSINPYTVRYSTIGLKTASVTITDSDSVQATCPPSTAVVNFNPNFEEF